MVWITYGNSCKVKPDWPESLMGTAVKSNLIGQNHPVDQGNPLYNWVLVIYHMLTLVCVILLCCSASDIFWNRNNKMVSLNYSHKTRSSLELFQNVYKLTPAVCLLRTLTLVSIGWQRHPILYLLKVLFPTCFIIRILKGRRPKY